MISPEILRRYPYFATLRDESLKDIAMMAEEVTVPAGQRMFGEGEPADFLYIIIRGEVDIQYLLGNGEFRTVDTLVDGDLLVWSSMIEPYRTTGFGTATKPTQLVKISACKLRDLSQRDPQVGYRLLIQVAKLLAHRLEGARVQLAAVD
jgi:CRP-like cAMP-binding protein